MDRLSILISSHLKTSAKRGTARFGSPHKYEKEIEKHLNSRTTLGGCFQHLDY